MTDASLTRYVAEWSTELSADDIPQRTRDIAIRHVLDGYGLALSGHVEESHAILCRSVSSVGADGAVYVLGAGQRTSAGLAELVNGLGMHAMDHDDTQLATDPESVYGLLTHRRRPCSRPPRQPRSSRALREPISSPRR
jgi:2-methylcitrate dehydratase PrpD